MNAIAKYVIELCITVYCVAYLLPGAIATLANSTNWSGAPSAVVTIGTTVLSILIILGIALALMPQELKSRMGL
jgi:hypothetical protein